MSIDTNCQVTNNSGEEILILNALNLNPSVPQVMYEKTLTVIPTTEGPTIPDEDTKTINLDITYTDPITGQPTQLLIYELIGAMNPSLFPVIDLQESLDFSTDTYPPISISQNNKEQMLTADRFYQYNSAFPSSNVSKGFYDACKQGYANNEVENTVNTFLQGTENFSNTNLNAIAAVTTYREMYACAWAANQPTYTYWIYYVPPSEDTKVFSPEETSIRKTKNSLRELQKEASCFVDLNTSYSFAGNIEFIKQANAPVVADPSKYDSYYDIFFIDTDNNQTQLYYERGAFTSNLGSSAASIYLLTSCAAKSSLTGDFSDNSIVPILAGTLNGGQVIGTNFQANTTGQSTPASVQIYFQVLRSLLALGYLGRILIIKCTLFVKKLQEIKAKTGKDPTSDETNRAKSETDSQTQDIQNNYQDRLDSANIYEKIRDPNDIDYVLMQTRVIYERVNIAEQVINQFAEIAADVKQLDIYSNYINNPDVQSVAKDLDTEATNLREAIKAINKANEGGNTEEIKAAWEQVGRVVANNASKLKNDNESLDTIYEEVDSKMSTTAQNESRKSAEISKDCEERQDDLSENQEEIKDGSNGDDSETEEIDFG